MEEQQQINSKRYFLELSYDGSAFAGWQKQPNSSTIQEEIEKGISQILSKKYEIVGSGRTDSGVHAKTQFAHFDCEKELGKKFIKGLNSVLPQSISISNIYIAKNFDAHARFSAELRGYEYHISKFPNVFERDFALNLHINNDFDFDNLEIASKILTEYSDFASFCKLHGNNLTTICHIIKSEWKFFDHKMIYFVEANRFLRGMVRALVGTMLEVGFGNMSIEKFREIIERKDRRFAGKNISPKGLFLAKVIYPEGMLTRIDKY